MKTDDREPARVNVVTTPRGQALARATFVTTPRVAMPARASGPTKPNSAPPARAIEHATPEDTTPARARGQTTPISPPLARADADPLLAYIKTLGAILDDVEAMRIMAGNRIGALEREHGEALPHLLAIVAPLDQAEHLAELELKRAWRRHPLAPWAAGVKGVGEKTLARLIAETGDPADRPNPGKLLAYCGHGDPARSGPIPKGATQAELFKRGNPHAKKRVHLVAEALIKVRCAECTAAERARRETPTQAAPWAPPPPSCTCLEQGYIGRVRYDDRRVVTVERTHESRCVRCGPAGHPALPGSPWSDAHKHADALRIVGKRFLIDLWKTAVGAE